jgi:SAM-dependent MidA family methyltransferase
VSLAERLRERIQREGPISFADFMEAALYDPEEGYYSRGAPIGEGGDFVTSPSVSAAFAATIARLFARDAASLTGDLTFVEVGAGEGRFLSDFARALERDSPEVAARTRIVSIERAPVAREKLAERGFTVLSDVAGTLIHGWIFANELYDALPVCRVIGAADDGIEELRICVEEEHFAWTHVPAPSSWIEFFSRFDIALEPGQIAEIRPGAADLHRELARALERGRLVVFDYGHRARTLYHPLARRGGTLAVHSRGRRGGEALDRPGQQDLTAHVNWDEILAVGEEEGLASEGPTRQGRFLTQAGVFDFASDNAEKWRIYRLVDPAGMGDEISVLVQSRAITPLSF